MVPGTFEAVAIILLAIVPGYLAIATWARAKTWKGFGGDLDTVLRSLAASLLVQVPMFPLALRWGLYPNLGQLRDRPGTLFAWLLLTVLVVPIGGGFVLGAFYDRYLLPLARQPRHLRRLRSLSFRWQRWGLDIPIPASLADIWIPKPPSGWDRFVLQNLPDGSFLVVDLEDGTQVTGVWEEGSYAITSPAPHALFLNREWVLNEDGRFAGFVDDTHGVFIRDAAKIRKIRVLL